MSEEQLKEIKVKAISGAKVTKLAEEYGVSRQTIYGLANICQHCSRTIDITVEDICKKFDLNAEFRKIINYYRYKTKCKNKNCASLTPQNGIKNDLRVLRKYE